MTRWLSLSLFALGCNPTKDIPPTDSASPAGCSVWYDGCNDPCTPLCVPSSSVPSTTCDLGCTVIEDPPSECGPIEDGCDWLSP